MKPASALSRNRTPAAVLRRLDINPAEVALVPTEPWEILSRCFASGKSKKVPRQRLYAYASTSQSPVCRQFMESIRTIAKKDLELLSFEAMCVRARVSPVEMLGAVLMAAKSMKATESALKAILAHPDLVDTTVTAAKIPGPAGYSDRRMLHEAVGFLPTKKGGIEINLGFGRPEEDRDGEPDADDAWDEAFPDLGSQVNEWSANKHKLIEGGK